MSKVLLLIVVHCSTLQYLDTKRTVYPHTVLQGRIILTLDSSLDTGRFIINRLLNLNDNCTPINNDLLANSEYAGTSQSLFNFSQECYSSSRLHEADHLPVTRANPGLDQHKQQWLMPTMSCNMRPVRIPPARLTHCDSFVTENSLVLYKIY